MEQTGVSVEAAGTNRKDIGHLHLEELLLLLLALGLLGLELLERGVCPVNGRIHLGFEL